MNWGRYHELIALKEGGQIKESVAGMTELLNHATDSSERAAILMALANGLRELRLNSDARRKLNEASELLGPTNEYYPRVLHLQAALDMDEKNWRGALKKLDEIEEGYSPILQLPSHLDLLEEVHRRRGVALAELGKFAEARPLLESVRSIEYDQAATLCTLGMCDFELKDFDAAKDVFAELLSLQPASAFRAYAYYYIGIIFYRQGQMARAKASFDASLGCPDRFKLSEKNILHWLINTAKELNQHQEVERYSVLLKIAEPGESGDISNKLGRVKKDSE